MVNIVLKADQPTGRTVSGAVSELLTCGDHPRGVKVRLTDGRVGRVQSLQSGEEPSGPKQEGVDRERRRIQEAEGGMRLRTEGGDASGRRNRFGAHDMRLDGPEEPSSEPLGLDMYIRPAKGKKRGGTAQVYKNVDDRRDGTITDASATTQTTAAVVSCPICNTFEGDEAAVAHHVAGHFGE
ncbi:uncharacterized protein N7484_007865 [Penicillium longicatenatum]|uniref:uncharacterized protein n=1 Tax=Penicillium longicatenatum TaxID=1561947 RepID=UPI0025468D07|nr:uncharacterized protein N7484_007865 [Penicillium longicatenatum]KAJ5640003.1 hypothetical protein N7484_007865 [Penicillium longicatenatum]